MVLSGPLVARLSGASQHQLSLRPGRNGWTITSPLPYEWLRRGLSAWCPRVCVLHAESGRFFVRPGTRYIRHVLRAIRPAYHEAFHSCPVRQERLRRLRPFLDRTASRVQPMGAELLFTLALRLEAAKFQSKPDKIWRHLSKDFDRLWATVPLFALNLEVWQAEVLKVLCAPVSATQELGTISDKDLS